MVKKFKDQFAIQMIDIGQFIAILCVFLIYLNQHLNTYSNNSSEKYLKVQCTVRTHRILAFMMENV